MENQEKIKGLERFEIIVPENDADYILVRKFRRVPSDVLTAWLKSQSKRRYPSDDLERHAIKVAEVENFMAGLEEITESVNWLNFCETERDRMLHNGDDVSLFLRCEGEKLYCAVVRRKV